jgi:hypothetical protein
MGASRELSSQPTVAGIVIDVLVGVTLLVVGAICLSKGAFQAVKMRRSVDEPLGLEDQTGSSAVQEREEAMRLLRDQQRR